MLDFTRSGSYHLGRNSRVLFVLWSLLLAAGFFLAYRLEPDPRGFGTHQRLGLPPCTFRVMFGLPCPSCGMTTSFAHFSRGHFIQAFRANAGGMLLALLCLAQIPWCLWSAACGCTIGMARPVHGLLYVMVAVAGVSGAQWLVQLHGG